MHSPLENGRATKPRGTDEEFVLYLRGIPAHCRWQELKDLVRQTALHIRQAVVYDDRHGFPTGLGQIIVKNEEEAWRTYQKLSTNGWEGQSLTVTLARTSSPTTPIAGPTKSPPCMFPSTYVQGYSTPPRATQNLAVPPSPMSPEPVPTTPSYPCSEYGQMLSPMGLHHNPHNFHPYVPVYTDSVPPSMHGIPTPPYALPNDPIYFTILPTYPTQLFQEIPIPNTNNIHPTPRRAQTRPRKPFHNHPNNQTRRAIFIQNLHPATTATDLKLHIHSAAGPIESCDVFSDPETGRCKGYARVTFLNADEARRAVMLLNNTFFLGLTIRVKFDRFAGRGSWTDSSDVGAAWGGVSTGPVIADAGGQQCQTEVDAPKPADVGKCQQQPLVVNGSGLGGRKVDAVVESY